MIPPRPEVLVTPLATHGGRLGIVGEQGSVLYDFSVCLNAYGPADIVREAIRNVSPDEYPDPHCRAPREVAATLWKRSIDEIAFGAGAAEFIHAVCFAYVRPGDKVLIATPAFGEYERAARLCGAVLSTCPYGALGDTPEEDAESTARICDSIARIRPRLTFLCTPSNPTGHCTSRADLTAIADTCEAAGSLLVLDQAYDAFTARPVGSPALPGRSAVLHLRSLTKEHALAGVRVAFAIGPVEVIRILEQVRVPWSASSTAQAAGVAAFTNEAEQHVQDSIARLRIEAVRLADDCSHLGFTTRSSATHFFLVHVGDAQRAQDILSSRAGIYVRDCTSFGLPAWIRIAARRPAENDVLLNAFHTFNTLLHLRNDV
ncbi:MAG TPA: histidinol-phosphate transaminase [Gemmatimonadaceae bacterium]|nr:histidinol-phosphate transaminase [Gemmatimonadaceae bacterium]